jgi:hypothetical protein
VGLLEAFYQGYQNKVTVKDLCIKTEDEKLQMVLRHVPELTVSEAAAYFRALMNAIEIHKYQKNKDLKVEDLGIVLLD